MPHVFLSLGSNQQREENLTKALAQLQQHFSPLNLSAVYESQPINKVGDNYYNICVGFETQLSLTAIREILNAIEQQLGRDRGDPKCVAIDIDLLLYGDRVEENTGYDLPHPDIRRYAHVLVPLQEVAPDLILPDTGVSLRQLNEEVAGDDSLRRIVLMQADQ